MIVNSDTISVIPDTDIVNPKAKLKPYYKSRDVFLSKEVFDKCRFNIDSIYAQRLLYGLIQSLDQTQDMFPEWEIEINVLFKYLNIEKDTAKYSIVKDAFLKLQENPLQWHLNDRRWRIIPWFTKAEYDEKGSSKVKVILNNEAKPYLLTFKSYVKFKTEFYMQLGTLYSIWLYPYFKNNEWRGNFTVTIEKLKEWTFTDKIKSYNPEFNPAANNDFLKNVLGIKRNKATNQWESIKTKYKLKGSDEYVEKPAGTLHEINTKTDITVMAEPRKNGRSFDKIDFYISTKATAVEERHKRQKQIELEISNKPTLFSDSTKSYEKRIHISEVLAASKDSGLSADNFAKKAGYEKQGEWYIKK
jgi:plasmid replication initiation protein